MKRITNQIFLVLSTIGFIDALFLTEKHYSKEDFGCPIFGGCEIVTNSVYSEIFGIPVSLLGMIFYGIIFSLSLYSFLTNKKTGIKLASQLSLAGFLMSLGLVYIMVYVLQAICFYCLLSAITSTTMFIVGFSYLNYFKILRKYKLEEFTLGLTRISLGFVFFWAFWEKLPKWIEGSSPTFGFLTKGTSGIFAEFFASLANFAITDYLYMFGLAAVGIALILGIEMWWAAVGGSMMMFFIYLAVSLPPAHNPLIDEHIIYIFILILLYKFNAGRYIGFQDRWKKITKRG